MLNVVHGGLRKTPSSRLWQIKWLIHARTLGHSMSYSLLKLKSIGGPTEMPSAATLFVTRAAPEKTSRNSNWYAKGLAGAKTWGSLVTSSNTPNFLSTVSTGVSKRLYAPFERECLHNTLAKRSGMSAERTAPLVLEASVQKTFSMNGAEISQRAIGINTERRTSSLATALDKGRIFGTSRS